MADKQLIRGKGKVRKWFGENWLAVVIIVIFSLMVWWPTRNLPYHWDGADYVVPMARELRESNFGSILVNEKYLGNFAHPWLLMMILAAAWQVWGEHIWISHLVLLPTLPIFLFSSYLIFKKILTGRVAIVSTLLLGMTPVVMAEYGMVHLDLPMSALAMAALAAAIYGRLGLTIGLLCLAASVKEVALLLTIPVGYLIARGEWELCKLDKGKAVSRMFRKALPKILLLGLPWLIYVGWATVHMKQTNWWLFNPGMAETQVSIGYRAISIIFDLGFEQGRWLITTLGIVGGIIGWRHGEKFKMTATERAMESLVIGFVGLFTGLGFYIPRYGILVSAAILGLSLCYLKRTLETMSAKWAEVGLLVVIGAAGLIYGNNFYSRLRVGEYEEVPVDLSYMDVIEISQQAAEYLEDNYPEAVIYGDWPEVHQLTNPNNGFVNKSFDFDYCFRYENKILEETETVLIYVHQNSKGQVICKQLVQKLDARPLKSFEENGRWLEIYRAKIAAPGSS